MGETKTLQEKIEAYKLKEAELRAERIGCSVDEVLQLQTIPAEVMLAIMAQQEKDLIKSEDLTRIDISKDCSILVINSENVGNYSLKVQIGERRNKDILINQYITDMAQQQGKFLSELRDNLSK